MPPKNMPPKKVSGSFDADGAAHIVVELPWEPQDIQVEFSGDPTKVPAACDLHLGDDLGFTLVQEGITFAIRIHWKVTGVRTVNWLASRS